MTARGFDTGFADLPPDLAIFPLPGVVLFPRVDLPLNIFEPRYIAMVDHALHSSRLIGMVQPQVEKTSVSRELCRTGTAGRIIALEETDDGRYLMTLRGICRFDVLEEQPQSDRGFRRVRANWTPYQNDLTEDRSADICRDKLVGVLKDYLDKKEMTCAKWEQVRAAGCERLLATLTMICPFAAQEKQALLEAKTLKERADMLLAFLDIARRHQEGSCH